jgi:hypothetical protein
MAIQLGEQPNAQQQGFHKKRQSLIRQNQISNRRKWQEDRLKWGVLTSSE